MHRTWLNDPYDPVMLMCSGVIDNTTGPHVTHVSKDSVSVDIPVIIRVYVLNDAFCSQLITRRELVYESLNVDHY